MRLKISSNFLFFELIFLVLVIIFLPLTSADTFGVYITPPETTTINIGTGNVTTFLNLTDTPSSYAGEGGNCVAVNVGETGLEFISCAGAAGSNLTSAIANATYVKIGSANQTNLHIDNITNFDYNYNQTTIDTSAFVNCTADEVFLGNGTCMNITLFYEGTSNAGKKGDGGYLYNDTDTMYFNDTLLNDTIDSRAITAETDPVFVAQNQTIWDAILNRVTSAIANATYVLIGSSNQITLDIDNITNFDYNYNQTQPAIDYIDEQGFITSAVSNDTYVKIGSSNQTLVHISNVTNFDYNYNQTTPANSYTDEQIGYINNTENMQNLLNSTGIYSTYNATYDAFEDTNETERFGNLVADDCPAGYLVLGVQANGTVLCALDNGGLTSAIANDTYVRFTGSEKNVDLGDYNLTSSWLKAAYLSNGSQDEYFDITFLDTTETALGDIGIYPMFRGNSDGALGNILAIANGVLITPDTTGDSSIRFTNNKSVSKRGTITFTDSGNRFDMDQDLRISDRFIIVTENEAYLPGIRFYEAQESQFAEINYNNITDTLNFTDAEAYMFNGNVGIGIAIPRTTLDVYGNATFEWNQNYVPGTSYAAGNLYAANFTQDAIPIGVYGHIVSQGNTSTGHALGVLGLADDNLDNAFNLIGVEGRADGSSNTSGIIYEGLRGYVTWTDPDGGDSTTFAGTIYGLDITREITDNDGTTPRAEGNSIGIHISDTIGGATNYGLYVQNQTGGTEDYGIVIDDADTAALWIGAGADNQDAANGITFGQSKDVNLYRGDTDMLTTDDKLNITKDLVVHGTTNLSGLVMINQEGPLGLIVTPDQLNLFVNGSGGSQKVAASGSDYVDVIPGTLDLALGWLGAATVTGNDSDELVHWVYGTRFAATADGGNGLNTNLMTVFGSTMDAESQTGAYVGEARGLQARGYATGGEIGTAYGVWGSPEADDGGNITTGYGLYATTVVDEGSNISTVYGVYIDTVENADYSGDIDQSWSLWSDGGNSYFEDYIGIATSTPTYPLEVNSNVSGISIWSQANVSATGYMTRTSVFDPSKVAKDYVKNSTEYLNPDGSINHSSFYGYTTYEVTDYSRPVEQEFKKYDQQGNEIVEIITTYPYKTTEEAVNIESEINVLRQLTFEQQKELEALRAELEALKKL